MRLSAPLIARLVVVSGLIAFLSACATSPPNDFPGDTLPSAAASQTDAVQAAAEGKVDAVERLSINRFELLPSKQVSPPKASRVPTTPATSNSSDVAEAPTELSQNVANPLDHELQRGTASWYGSRFQGRLTASGERYDQQALTAAHRTLPFGTLVRVRSLVNGHEVEVRITDRGPYALGAEGHTRIIDVSRAAAVELDMMGLGAKEVVLFVEQSVAIDAPPLPKPKTRSSAKKRLPVRKHRRH